MSAWSAQRAARDRRIIYFAKRGHCPAEIRKRFPGIDNRFISTVLSRARAAGEDIPLFNSHGEAQASTAEGSGFVTIKVRALALDRLAPAAAARRVSAAELARRIVETVSREDIVEAVLADGDESKLVLAA